MPPGLAKDHKKYGFLRNPSQIKMWWRMIISKIGNAITMYISAQSFKMRRKDNLKKWKCHYNVHLHLHNHPRCDGWQSWKLTICKTTQDVEDENLKNWQCYHNVSIWTITQKSCTCQADGPKKTSTQSPKKSPKKIDRKKFHLSSWSPPKKSPKKSPKKITHKNHPKKSPKKVAPVKLISTSPLSTTSTSPLFNNWMQKMIIRNAKTDSLMTK